jgi:hypothetical protein
MSSGYKLHVFTYLSSSPLRKVFHILIFLAQNYVLQHRNLSSNGRGKDVNTITLVDLRKAFLDN